MLNSEFIKDKFFDKYIYKVVFTTDYYSIFYR